MNFRKLIIVAIFLCFCIQNISAFQKASITIKKDSFKFLEDEFDKNKKDSTKAIVYANKYLSKAIEISDTLKIVKAYYFLSRISSNSIAQKYNDSIIEFSKGRDLKDYPAYAYSDKADIFYKEGNFKNAFDYYLIANQKAKKRSNQYLFFYSEKMIASLKIRLGEYKEALTMFKGCYTFYKNNKKYAKSNYLTTLFSLSDVYRRNHLVDSATILNRLGYREALILKKEKLTSYFTLNEGINQYDKENYATAIDSLKKSIIELENNKDLGNAAIAHFYLGKTLRSLGNTSEALVQFKKVDAIFREVKRIMPETRESYEHIINYYKNKKDKDNQLRYIERLLSADSVLQSNYKYLITNVTKSYDTPQLISEKQEIINALKQEKKTSKVLITALVLLSLIFLSFLVYNYQKRKKYKLKFEELYKNTTKENTTIAKIDVKKDEVSSIGISKEVVEDILDKLRSFEEEAGFLQSNITVNNLAKKFKTNSKYLSKVINVYKEKSFTVYINELRIDYAIEKLKVDKRFRKYTIKAIAFETGFNTIVAFSRSFYKKTGIHPSYFIKELEKQESI